MAEKKILLRSKLCRGGGVDEGPDCTRRGSVGTELGIGSCRTSRVGQS